MLTNLSQARKTRGFTLTEAAIVLGIVGLILGAIWVAAAAVYTNMRVTTTSRQLLAIVQSVRSIHATQNIITLAAGNAGAIQIAQAGGIPKDMVTLSAAGAVTAVRDSWGGNVLVDDANAGASFTVGFDAVPQGACVDLLVRNTGANRDAGMTHAGVGATLVDVTGDPDGFSVGDAVTACSTTGAAGNLVNFTFRLKI